MLPKHNGSIGESDSDVRICQFPLDSVENNYEALACFLSNLYLNVLILFSNEYINLVNRGA